MDAIETITGPVSVLDRDDVDTDQIMPKQFLKRVERTGFGEYLFYDWAKEPGWDLPKNQILVTGRNFGCGSSREHAPWGLEDYGFRTIIAESFADIFRSNCTKIGLLPVELGEADCKSIQEAGSCQVDLASQEVRWEAGGELRTASFEIDPEIKHRLLNGLDDIALTLQQDDAIATYERGGGGDLGADPVAAVRVLDAVCDDLTYEEHAFGGASIDAHGSSLTDETLAACKGADAVLLGAVGGPKWDSTDASKDRPERGLLGIRKELGLFANLRPVRPLPALYDASPLKREHIEGTDLLVVRELTGGIYFGEKVRTADMASDLCAYTVGEVERIARVAFRAARRKVSSIDKANVMETSRLWREVVTDTHAAEFADVPLEHVLADNASMQLISRPADFDVLLADNLFGDILSDEAAMLTGSIGMLPSASLGEEGTPGLFEPVHGSAPDIAGTGAANPLATILSAALLLRHGLGREPEAARLESAVDRALEQGLRTRDLGGSASTDEATHAVLAQLEVQT